MEARRIQKHPVNKEKRIKLYRTPGITYSIADFSEKNMHLLSDYEQGILRKGWKLLKKQIPEGLEIPLQRNRKFGKRIGTEISPNGFRSAYDQERKIKFKGCNPHPERGWYYSTTSDFGETSPKTIRESWGVMGPIGIMREILAVNFLQQNNLPNVLEPLCVYHYIDVEKFKSLGCCLVERSRHNLRLGDIEDSKDLGRLSLFNQNLFRKIMPLNGKFYSRQEIEKYVRVLAHIEKMSVSDYAEREMRLLRSRYDKPMGLSIPLVNHILEKQTELLARLHFMGFLRNSTNGHQGNTIISGKGEICLCDFDMVRIVEIPKRPDLRFMSDFFLSCIHEVIESDFHYLTFVEHNDLSDRRSNQMEVFRKVHEKYLEISLYFSRYMELFRQRAKDLGWNMGLLEDAIAGAQRTATYFDTVMRHVRNTYTKFKIDPKYKDSLEDYKSQKEE